MDKECIDLCVALNTLDDIHTTESCCGHCKEPYMIFFDCTDFYTLGKLYRCVSRNYSDGMWRIEVCFSDTHPVFGFMLRSNYPFETYDEIKASVGRLIKNIDYWTDEKFDNYFKSSDI